jgi:hypothetical protein
VAYLSQIIWIDSACSDFYVSFLKTIMLKKEFAPGEEPTVYTADLCAEVGHEHLRGN